MESSLPDKLLHLTHGIPNDWGLRILKRIFVAHARTTRKLTRIRFGNVEITAPLDHPSVYWRYSPAGFNQNYVLLIRRILQARTGLIIDVGANIGDGVALLRGAGIETPILAIEGTDVWFSLLRSNTQTLSDVALEHVFLGPADQDNHLALRVQNGSAKLIQGESNVATVSLDTLLRNYQDHRVVLLKTDTDGFDAKVLFGARSLLKEQLPVVFAEVDEGLLRDQGNSSQELLDYLSGCGYSAVVAWDHNGKWLATRPIHQGIADLIARYPGGPNTPYLDVAAFSETDRNIAASITDGV